MIQHRRSYPSSVDVSNGYERAGRKIYCLVEKVYFYGAMGLVWRMLRYPFFGLGVLLGTVLTTNVSHVHHTPFFYLGRVTFYAWITELPSENKSTWVRITSYCSELPWSPSCVFHSKHDGLILSCFLL